MNRVGTKQIGINILIFDQMLIKTKDLPEEQESRENTTKTRRRVCLGCGEQGELLNVGPKD